MFGSSHSASFSYLPKVLARFKDLLKVIPNCYFHQKGFKACHLNFGSIFIDLSLTLEMAIYVLVWVASLNATPYIYFNDLHNHGSVNRAAMGPHA